MSPRISLMVSDALQTSDSESADSAAYVMPSLVGLSYAAAASRVAAAGLKLVAAEEIIAPPGPVAPVVPPVTSAASGASAAGTPVPPPQAPVPTAPPTSGTVIAQTPQPGFRVQQGDAVHITVSHATPAE